MRQRGTDGKIRNSDRHKEGERQKEREVKKDEGRDGQTDKREREREREREMEKRTEGEREITGEKNSISARLNSWIFYQAQVKCNQSIATPKTSQKM